MANFFEYSRRRGNTECRKIDTKDFCFFCLKTAKLKTEESDEIDHFDRVICTVSLVCLRRHLKINLNQIIKISSAEAVQEIKASLCNNCKKLVDRFSVLFQRLEAIQMEIDFYLDKIHQSISCGAENPELVHNYSKGMTSEIETLTNLAWIDKLRKEISQKCAEIRERSVQTVELSCLSQEKIISLMPFTIKNELKEGDEEEEGNFQEQFVLPDSPSISSEEEQNNFPLAQKTVECSKTSLAHSSVPTRSLPVLKKRKKKRAECPSCGKIYSSPTKVRVHFEAIHLKKRWKCEICNVSEFAQANDLKKHKQMCLQMQKMRSKWEESRKHFKFPCPTCKTRFPNKTRLQRHKKYVHPSSRMFACEYCDKSFKTKTHLKIHTESVHLRKTWRCRHCSRDDFTYQTSCARHEKRCLQKSKIKVEITSGQNIRPGSSSSKARCQGITRKVD